MALSFQFSETSTPRESPLHKGNTPKKKSIRMRNEAYIQPRIHNQLRDTLQPACLPKHTRSSCSSQSPSVPVSYGLIMISSLPSTPSTPYTPSKPAYGYPKSQYLSLMSPPCQLGPYPLHNPPICSFEPLGGSS
jgi:hypothetical protein